MSLQKSWQWLFRFITVINGPRSMNTVSYNFFSTLTFCFNCCLLSLHVSTVNYVAVTHKSVIIHLIYTHPLPWNLITSWMFALPIYVSVEPYEDSSTAWTHVQWCKHGPYIFAQPSTFILCKEIWKKQCLLWG